MITQGEAFERLDRAMGGTRLPTETLPVGDAAGRVLATDQRCALDMPPFDKAAMDGYAVRAEDERESYRVLGTLGAGQAADSELPAGYAVQIMTGAPLPPGAGRVIQLERAQRHADRIRVQSHGAEIHVRRRAEDLKSGQRVLEAGTRLGVLEIANLLACGVRAVEVVQPPRVFVLSTGDELVDEPDQLAPGKILDSNGPMLASLARQFGLEVVGRKRVSDDRAETAAAIERALRCSDLVVLSGGVSMGAFDYVIEALESLGLRVHFSRVAIKPGKPTVFATEGTRPVFGLPGNPVSAFVMFHLFVLRAVAHMVGCRPGLRKLRLTLASDFHRRKAQRLLYMPCRLDTRGSLVPIPNNGSGHLAALLEADGFCTVPVGTHTLQAGEPITFLPMPRS